MPPKNLTSGVNLEEKPGDGMGPSIAEMQKDLPDEHPFMGKELTQHERLLIHLPIPQIKQCQSDCNQRLVYLYHYFVNFMNCISNSFFN